MGFSLTEVLVVFALTALIALGGFVMTVHTLRVSDQNNELGTIVHETGTVGYWVGHDLNMADEIFGDDPKTHDTEFLTLVWKDWQTGNVYNVHYALLEQPDSLKRIERRYYRYEVLDGIEYTSTMTIADNVYLAEISQTGTVWKLSIGSRSGSRDLINEYDISSRLNYSEIVW